MYIQLLRDYGESSTKVHEAALLSLSGTPGSGREVASKWERHMMGWRQLSCILWRKQKPSRDKTNPRQSSSRQGKGLKPEALEKGAAYLLLRNVAAERQTSSGSQMPLCGSGLDPLASPSQGKVSRGESKQSGVRLHPGYKGGSAEPCCVQQEVATGTYPVVSASPVGAAGRCVFCRGTLRLQADVWGWNSCQYS